MGVMASQGSTYGDKGWERYVTIPSDIFGASFLIVYWSIGWVQLSGRGIDHPTLARTETALMLYILGVSLMIASDAQKYYTLRYKKGLISDGLFYATRNPNYLGEMMLYGISYFIKYF